MVETQDTTGKTLERIRYSETTGLISFIEKDYYDSLQRQVFVNMTWFPDNKYANTNTCQLFYNSKGLISKDISTFGRDTTIIYYEYFPNKKIRQSKIISNSDVWWKGITRYFYDKNDSLIRCENWDLNGENLQDRDSIAYTDTSKTVFQINDAIKISSKQVTIYKNHRIVRQTEYSAGDMSEDKKFYADKETIFTYNENRLVKKVVKSMMHDAWCGTSKSDKIETYTYFYE